MSGNEWLLGGESLVLGDLWKPESTRTFERGDGVPVMPERLSLVGDAPFIEDEREEGSPDWNDNDNEGDKEEEDDEDMKSAAEELYDVYDAGF
jgi:hypothetical protein